MVFSRRRRIKPVAIDPATGRTISPWPFVGLVLLVSAAFLYGVSFWIVPWWVAVPMLLAWLVMMVLCFVWWTSRPRGTVALGVGAFVAWFLIVTGGGILFDWSA